MAQHTDFTIEPDPSSESEPSVGPRGSRELRISNAVGRVHKEFAGRGPTQVRTHIGDDVIVCLLEGGFTQVEQTAWKHDGERAVLELRHRLQQAMRHAIVQAVEAILQRRVRSFMSSNDPEHDIQAEVMVLHAPTGSGLVTG